MKAIEEHRCFGGVQDGPCPVLWCLAGLTCNGQTFAILYHRAPLMTR